MIGPRGGFPSSTEGRPDHVVDAGSAGRQHDEPIEPQRAAARLGHRRERGEELLVERVALTIAALPLGHLPLQPVALLGRIAQLSKTIGELDPAHVELEPLRYAWLLWRAPRQRRLLR